MKTISELRKKYPGALYSHVRIANYEVAFGEFIKSTSGNPQFTYAKEFTSKELSTFIDDLQQTEDAHDASSDIARFSRMRRLEYTVLEMIERVKNNPTQEFINAYRQLISSLCPEPSQDVLSGIMNYLEEQAIKNDQSDKITRLRSLVNVAAVEPLYRPSADSFRHYRRLFKDVFTEELRYIDSLTAELDGSSNRTKYKNTVDALLDYVGAVNLGWGTVLALKGGANISVSKPNKKIIIGRHFHPKSTFRLKQLLVHEVLIHVGRSIQGTEGKMIEEEGLAICAEQLLARRFIYKRMLRYFAAACAWGADGRKRDFRETYECVRLAYSIIAHSNGNDVNRVAFDETARVFRGGVPGVKGVAYTKDAVYFMSNIDMWKRLESELLDRDAFVRLIYGHDTMGWRTRL